MAKPIEQRANKGIIPDQGSNDFSVVDGSETSREASRLTREVTGESGPSSAADAQSLGIDGNVIDPGYEGGAVTTSAAGESSLGVDGNVIDRGYEGGDVRSAAAGQSTAGDGNTIDPGYVGGSAAAASDGDHEARLAALNAQFASDDSPLSAATFDHESRLLSLNSDDAGGDSVQGLSADRDDSYRSASADPSAAEQGGEAAMQNEHTLDRATEF